MKKKLDVFATFCKLKIIFWCSHLWGQWIENWEFSFDLFNVFDIYYCFFFEESFDIFCIKSLFHNISKVSLGSICKWQKIFWHCSQLILSITLDHRHHEHAENPAGTFEVVTFLPNAEGRGFYCYGVLSFRILK